MEAAGIEPATNLVFMRVSRGRLSYCCHSGARCRPYRHTRRYSPQSLREKLLRFVVTIQEIERPHTFESYVAQKWSFDFCRKLAGT